jgi:hypothetical protein
MRYCATRYDDGNDRQGDVVYAGISLRDAHKAAARAMGCSSLRGAARWESLRGGIAYQFGARADEHWNPYVVISWE